MADAVAKPGDGSFVFAVGPLPPPTHGQSVITEALTAHIGAHLHVHVANISPGERGRLRGHLTKIGRVVRALWQIAAKSRNYPARALYMASDGDLGIAYNIAVACMARAFGYRIFLHHHSFAYIDSYSGLMATLTWTMGRSGMHIVLCNAMAAGLRGRYAIDVDTPMIELSGAAFLEVTPRATPRRKGELRIGFLSNLLVEKGFDTAIDLLRAARREGLPVRLMLAGKSFDRRATQIVQSALAEFGEAIEYLGPLYGQQKAEFFHNIDAFVFPTRYVNEARPQAVLESLCFGVPVLTIARGCIASDVDETCGTCVPRDADFVACALPLIREWCANRESLARYSNAALNRASLLHETGVEQLAAIVKALG